MNKMKTVLLSALVGVGAMVFTVNGIAGDGCYLCNSGSKNGAQQCKYHGSDTQDQRKKCKEAGCKIGGTASCSSAANVKVIDPN